MLPAATATAVVSDDMAVVADQAAGLVNADAESRSDDSADWMLPNAEILVWMVFAVS